MRKKWIILSILYIVLNLKLVYPQWIKINNFQGNRLYDIEFDTTSASPETGWILSLDDTIYTTTNGSASWNNTYTNTSGTPYALKFIKLGTNYYGLMVGTTGRVWYSTNSGMSWNLTSPKEATANFLDVEYLLHSGSHAWIVGTQETIYYTPNEGLSWDRQHTGNETLTSVNFVNENCGWAVGHAGTIFHSENGSDAIALWKRQDSPANGNLNAVYFISPLIGWIAGESGVIMMTDTGGEEWTIQTSNITNTLNSISFIDKDNGVAVGENNTILHTVDGGATWIFESLPVSDSYIKVFYWDLENCWIISHDSGSLYYSQGKISINPFDNNKSFEIGSPLAITWESSYTKYVKIDLSTDNGENWEAALTNQTSAPDGYFETVTPNMPSTQCKIRIQSLKDSVVQDISEPFEIFQKSLTLTYPTGGEELTGGEKIKVTWESEYIDSINVKLAIHDEPNKAYNNTLSAYAPCCEFSLPSGINNSYCRILISESDGSPIDSSDYFTIKENTHPEIIFDPKDLSAHKGKDLRVVAKITDNNATMDTLFYRQVGDIEYSFDKFESIADSADYFKATIPANKVNERGLEFYIKSQDTSPESLETFYPDSFKNDSIPHSIAVSLDTMKYDIITSTPKHPKWQMISVPYKLADSGANSVFKNLLPYNSKKWRVWHWSSESSDYVEILSGKNIERGKSYFLAATSEFNTFTTGAGESFGPDTFEVKLEPGWNQIGHPFAFAVNYADIVAANDMSYISNFLEYKDGKYTPVTEKLEPCKGYFINNIEESLKYLTIPPIASDHSQNSLAKIEQPKIDWQIAIQAEIDYAVDSYNILGLCETSSPLWDILDQPEPPVVPGDYISLFFPHDNWEKYADHYSTDFRPAINDAQIWNFNIKTNVKSPVSKVIFEGIEYIPSEYKVILKDESLDITQNLRQHPVYKFPTILPPAKKRLKLVVATKNYVERHKLDAAEIPEKFELFQNFPNPFNMCTTFRYGLPKTSNVTIKIFNILGEEVITLLDDTQMEAGFQIQIWDGLDKYGKAVSSGLYIYQIKAGAFSNIKKLIVYR